MTSKRPEKRRLNRNVAFQAYAEMGAARSMNGLAALLKEQGYQTSRNTLTEWAREDRWSERLTDGAGYDKPELEVKAAIAMSVGAGLRTAEGADAVADALHSFAALVKGMVHAAGDALQKIEITNAEELLTLTRATTHMIEVAARSHEVLTRANDIYAAPKAKNVTPGQGGLGVPPSEVTDALAVFESRRKGA